MPAGCVGNPSALCGSLRAWLRCVQIGIMFGNPETTSGGNALKYYSSIRLDIRKKETVVAGEVATANKVRRGRQRGGRQAWFGLPLPQ